MRGKDAQRRHSRDCIEAEDAARGAGADTILCMICDSGHQAELLAKRLGPEVVRRLLFAVFYSLSPLHSLDLDSRVGRRQGTEIRPIAGQDDSSVGFDSVGNDRASPSRRPARRPTAGVVAGTSPTAFSTRLTGASRSVPRMVSATTTTGISTGMSISSSHEGTLGSTGRLARGRSRLQRPGSGAAAGASVGRGP